MDQEGLTGKDLLPIFKTRARLSEVMTRKRRLNVPMIRGLHERLSIPIESLMSGPVATCWRSCLWREGPVFRDACW